MPQIAPNQQLHRRKSSKDENETILLVSPPADDPTFTEVTVNGDHNGPSFTALGPPPSGKRNSLGPHTTARGHARSYSGAGLGLSPSSAGPMRTTFGFPQTNGAPLGSPLRSSFPSSTGPNGHHHSRNRSISAYTSLPSPLGLPNTAEGSFPTSALPSSTTLPRPPPLMTTSYSNPEGVQVTQSADYRVPPSPLSANGPTSATTAAQHKRRHSRMHSRNLSVFFPRPGTIPSTAISEDGDQDAGDEAPVANVPEAGSSVDVRGSRRGGGGNPPLTPLGQGFKFGGRPPSSTDAEDTSPAFSKPARRGHHHKHSMSHNFFSFLEPGSTLPSADLHTQPTPTPQSPWAPISAFPETASNDTTFAFSGGAPPPVEQSDEIPVGAAAAGVAQFVLGAWLWVSGQQIGSLSCTGLGYWVVFDAFGIGVGRIAPPWLARKPAGGASEVERKNIRRPYGNGRMETVLMFAQAVYLMFSSVYVCKETVEHLLLSAGGQEGHHHHSGDENPHAGIDFPIIIIFLTFASLLASAFFYENNIQLVNLSGNRLPTLDALVRSLSLSKRSTQPREAPTDPLAIVLTNPFVACPLFISSALLFLGLSVAPLHHRVADLVLALIIAVLTFRVSYRACVVLGNVLLQTAPPKGMPSGKLESLHRAVREIERHPHVAHLPPPHVWQLTPSLTSHAATAMVPKSKARTKSGDSLKGVPGPPAPPSSFANDQLVVTMEIHVRRDVGDDDVLALTKWAWERCVNALGGYKEFRDIGEVGGPEITVGVVRG